MTDTARLFASLVFASISVFLVIYTWLPALNSLQREDAQIASITPQGNTWYEVEIISSSGRSITCKSRRGWPFIGPNTCPLKQFEYLLGSKVAVAHDGKHPYQVVAGNEIVISYSDHRKVQIIAIALAGLMLFMAVLLWRRN